MGIVQNLKMTINGDNTILHRGFLIASTSIVLEILLISSKIHKTLCTITKSKYHAYKLPFGSLHQ